MKIGILGYTDKRPVIYPILKLLQSTGDVALITDNRHYSRILEEGGTSGHFVNIMISVTDLSPDEVWENIGYAPNNFEHVVYDLRDTVPADIDKLIVVKGMDFSEYEKELIEMVPDAEILNLIYDKSSKPVKNSLSVRMGMEIVNMVETIESKQILTAVKSIELINAIDALLGEKLGLSKKVVKTKLQGGWKKP